MTLGGGKFTKNDLILCNADSRLIALAAGEDEGGYLFATLDLAERNHDAVVGRNQLAIGLLELTTRGAGVKVVNVQPGNFEAIQGFKQGGRGY